jgi:hypothetical protein
LYVQKMDNSLPAAIGTKKKQMRNNFVSPQKDFLLKWPQTEAYLISAVEKELGLEKKKAFIKIIRKQSVHNNSYLETIKSLTPVQAGIGTDWLNQIVAGITGHCFSEIQTQRKKDKEDFCK